MRDDLIALFADPDSAARALQALREEQVSNARIVSAAPFPAVRETGRPGPWRALGRIALFGGLTGLGCAVALEVATSRSMNLIVGGKPIVAWTAFGVVMFELTMLFAGLFNFTALVVLSAFARRGVSRRGRDGVTTDRLVVVVPLAGCSVDREAAIRRSLSGALEVLP
jgi:hypothetical protein